MDNQHLPVKEDPMLDIASKVTADQADLTPSLLAQQLHIGHPRAARILQQLEAERRESGLPYPRVQPTFPPAVAGLLKRKDLWVVFLGLVLLLAIGLADSWLTAAIVVAICAFGVFTVWRLRESTRIVVCRNCGTTMTLKRFRDNDGCIKCGSDVYDKTSEHLKR